MWGGQMAAKLGFRVEAAVTRRVMGDCAKKITVYWINM